MEFERAVRRRRMARRFDPHRRVGPDDLDPLLDLARRAPSAGHTQGWHFLVLTEQVERDRFWSATTDTRAPDDTWLTGLRTAPALVVCWSDREAYERRYAEPDKRRSADAGAGLEQRWPVPYWDVDVGMAAMVLLLAAADTGLSACLFAVPTDRVHAVRTAFAVPERFTPVAVVALGHPAPDGTAAATGSGRRGRRPWAEVVSYGRYGAGRSDADGSASPPG